MVLVSDDGSPAKYIRLFSLSKRNDLFICVDIICKIYLSTMLNVISYILVHMPEYGHMVFS